MLKHYMTKGELVADLRDLADRLEAGSVEIEVSFDREVSMIGYSTEPFEVYTVYDKVIEIRVKGRHAYS